GHSAIYDETVNASGIQLQRMVVFGGGKTNGQDPTDSKVWELRFVPGTADTATWYEMTVDGTEGPSPRFWHTMSSADTSIHVRPFSLDSCHAAIMFGGRLHASPGANACSDTLWKLWLLKNGHVRWDRIAAIDSTAPGKRARLSMVLDP